MIPGQVTVGDPVRILFVCTANQCRSPLAAAIARRDGSGLPLEIASAGIIAGGHGTPPTGVRVARELGLDLDDHVSVQLTERMLNDADVVLTMTREQARTIVAARPELWPRVFTLKQFSRWLDGHARPSDRGARSWLQAAGIDRKRTELVGSSRDDDVFDPLHSPARVWRTVAKELAIQIETVLGALFPEHEKTD